MAICSFLRQSMLNGTDISLISSDGPLENCTLLGPRGASFLSKASNVCWRPSSRYALCVLRRVFTASCFCSCLESFMLQLVHLLSRSNGVQEISQSNYVKVVKNLLLQTVVTSPLPPHHKSAHLSRGGCTFSRIRVRRGTSNLPENMIFVHL